MWEAVIIKDAVGAVRDEAWLRGRYGDVGLRLAPAGTAFRVVELYEQFGAANLEAKVLDKDALPAEGIAVARRWPYREPNPNLQPLPDELATWFDAGVWGYTKVDGMIGYSTGAGDYYWPPNQRGASTIWVAGMSDAVEGLGILQETGYPHMVPVFMFKDEEPPPPDELRKLLLQVKAHLAQAQAANDKALELVP
jgi:hypothetical protein